MKNYYHERIVAINKCFVLLQTIWFLFGKYAPLTLFFHFLFFFFKLTIFFSSCKKKPSLTTQCASKMCIMLKHVIIPFILFSLSLSLSRSLLPPLVSLRLIQNCSFMSVNIARMGVFVYCS